MPTAMLAPWPPSVPKISLDPGTPVQRIRGPRVPRENCTGYPAPAPGPCPKAKATKKDVVIWLSRRLIKYVIKIQFVKYGKEILKCLKKKNSYTIAEQRGCIVIASCRRESSNEGSPRKGGVLGTKAAGETA